MDSYDYDRPRSNSLTRIIRTCLSVLHGLVLISALAAPVAVQASDSDPNVLYTDLTSGPNTGGENNQGVYLSIFGRNLGTTGLGTTSRVYIGSVEVANYRAALDPNTKLALPAGTIGPCRGRSDIQQITVQVGALTGLCRT